MRHFLSRYIIIFFSFIHWISTIILLMIWIFFKKSKQKSPFLPPIPFSDWLTLVEWEQQIALQECHLAHIHVAFHKMKAKKKKFSNSLSKCFWGVSDPAVRSMWLVDTKGTGGALKLSEEHQIVSQRTTHWHQHSGKETNRENCLVIRRINNNPDMKKK